MYIDPASQSTRPLFNYVTTIDFQPPPHYNKIISIPTQEARIILTIKAIHTAKRISIRTAAKAYNILRTTLTDQLVKHIAKRDIRNGRHQLTPTKKESLIQYIIDLVSGSGALQNRTKLLLLLCSTNRAEGKLNYLMGLHMLHVLQLSTAASPPTRPLNSQKDHTNYGFLFLPQLATGPFNGQTHICPSWRVSALIISMSIATPF